MEINSPTYDDPNDIDSVSLTIQTQSGTATPVIIANGRNQLPIEIIAKAMKHDKSGRETVLRFSDETWTRIVNLRYAETDELLLRNGSNDWCFTNIANDFSREVVANEWAICEPDRPKNDAGVALPQNNDGSKTMLIYVYTSVSEGRRVAVSIDTDNGKHFTTADDASGAEKMSVPVTALASRPYQASDIERSSNEIGKGQATYSRDQYVYLTTRQTNIYFSPKTKSRKITSFAFEQYAEHDNDHQLSAHWFFYSFEQALYVGWAWPFGEQSSRCITIFDKSNDTFSQTIDAGRDGCVAVTVMEFTANDTVDYVSDVFNPGESFYDFGCKVNIFDQYGEEGRFKVKYGDSTVWFEDDF